MEYFYPGSFTRHPLVHEMYPETEFDPSGVPYGIQPNYNDPFIDAQGEERCVWVYRPSTMRPMMSVHALLVLTDDGDEDAFGQTLAERGFLDLAEREGIFIIFAAANGCWQEYDDDYLRQLIHSASISCLFSGRERCHDYKIGIVAEGRGAELAHRTVSFSPEHVNSILSFGGSITCKQLTGEPYGAATSVWLVNATGDGYKFWYLANGLSESDDRRLGDSIICSDPENRARQVRRITAPGLGFDGGILLRFWYDVFRMNINPFSTGRGRIANIQDALDAFKPSVHLRDRSLGDNSHAPHDWLEFVPSRLIDDGARHPLVVFLHGGACDGFIEAANTGLHRLGEREGFITVYATATNGYSWNSVLHPQRNDDVSYIAALIDHMRACYPVDPARVYISGFSNGSGMAQLFAASHPEMVAGVLAFNTRFRVDEKVRLAAAEPKSHFDYRMPVYYSYGTEDAEYPLCDGCGQFTQISFWKEYNNIPHTDLNAADPSGVGAPSDRVYDWGCFGSDGTPIFTTHEFRTLDASGLVLYNYTFVKGLPHAVEPRLIPAGWAFLSRFSRQLDGSLKYDEGSDAHELCQV